MEEKIKRNLKIKEIKKAINYMENIWGDYGRYERNTIILMEYIKSLENGGENLHIFESESLKEEAEWINLGREKDSWFNRYKCSNCEETENNIYRICPNCNKRMKIPDSYLY